MYNYRDLLSRNRIRHSTIKRSKPVDEFYSDRSRILYSSSFRRLAQKAQVFSLEPNSSVRTRLTHSIEVSDLGRTLANKIAYKLLSKEIITIHTIPSFVAVVENSCLVHDFGNPPFGHFGEAAIRKWATDNLILIADEMKVPINEVFNILFSDFFEFDGNPQGFRIITKLHFESDEHSLNLTYATLLASLKYARASGEEKGSGILKKAGYFQSEKDIVEKIRKEVGILPNRRFPLAYIMEAADDIAYCLSDISDGIEKGILTAKDFLNEFKLEWLQQYGDAPCPVKVPDNVKNFGIEISVRWSKVVMNEACENYLAIHEQLYIGSANQLIPPDKIGRVLETIKTVSRRKLYCSSEAENIELTGNAVISGLLKHYMILLKIKRDKFKLLVEGKESGLDLERRLFNRLGKRYVKCYINEICKINEGDELFQVKELWLRTHLIIDHISGMTDDFALETYQMLEGIKLFSF